MFWLERNTGGVLSVRFRGVLDASTAREVRPFLSGGPGSRIALELSQATDVDYYGLSALVAEIVESGSTVSLRGLRSSHLRVLRYFGFDPARLDLGGGLDEDT